MSAEHADGPVAVPPPGVLHVDVEDALAEYAQELDVVDALVAEVRRVVVEAERRMTADLLEGALGGRYVERDLGGVHLERELDAVLSEHVENWLPRLRERAVAI